MIRRYSFKKSIYILISFCITFFYGITIEAIPPKKGGEEREDSDRSSISTQKRGMKTREMLDLQNYSSVLAAERSIGQQEERIRTAQSMIEDQFTNDVITRLTKLSLEEIEKLRNPRE